MKPEHIDARNRKKVYLAGYSTQLVLGIFDEEKDFQLVISPWEPEEYLKLGSAPAAKEQKKLRAREAARKLADMGGTMPDMQPICASSCCLPPS